MNENDALQDPLSQSLDETPQKEAECPDEPLLSDVAGEEEPLLAPLAEDPSPDLSPLQIPSESGDPLGELRRELEHLKESLQVQGAADARIAAERAEFAALYPQTPLTALPDAVWEDVRRGIPLAAAYALSERRRTQTEAIAAHTNRVNRSRSSGEVGQNAPTFFSASEVRAMSAEEVRRNYPAILRSMREWY